MPPAAARKKSVPPAQSKSSYGWQPDLPDHRDHVYGAPLAKLGPLVFGFTVYESFESPAVAKSGVLNLPTSAEKVAGGHAVLCVGFDDKAQRFTVRNSWGPV